jgi:hypothetical protein
LTQDEAQKLVATIATQFIIHGRRADLKGASVQVPVNGTEAFKLAADIVGASEGVAAELYPSEPPR